MIAVHFKFDDVIFSRSNPPMSYRSVLNVSNGGRWNPKLTLKINSLRIKHKAQNFASWMFSESAFKIGRKKGNDFFIIVPLKQKNNSKLVQNNIDSFKWEAFQWDVILKVNSTTWSILFWLSGIGCPVHGYIQKKPHSCKGTKMATLLDFCKGMSRLVNWYHYWDMINVSKPCELILVLDLSFHSVGIGSQLYLIAFVD